MVRISDLITACLLIVLSIYIFHETSLYPEPFIEGAPGASAFPNVLAFCLIVLSVILIIDSFRHKSERVDSTNWKAIAKISIDLILIIAFLVILEFWDIFILMPLLLAATMFIMGEKSIKAIILLPLAFDLFVYVVFYRMFHVMLPTIYF